MANCNSFPVSRATLMQEKMGLLGGSAVYAGKSFTWNGAPSFYHFTGNNEFFDALLGWKGIHGIQQEFFKDHHQPTGSDFSLNRLSGDSFERVFREFQLHIIEFKLLLILLYQTILRFRQDFDQCAFIQLMKDAGNWQAANKFRDQAKPNQIFGLHLRECLSMAMHA